MKIAILHTSLDVKGGAERQVLKLAIELQKSGHEVKIYVSKLDAPKCYPELIEQVKVTECGGPGYKNHRKAIIASSRYMKQMAERIEECDIINCHNYPTVYAAVLAKRRFAEEAKIKKAGLAEQITEKGKAVPIVWMCNEPPFPPLFKEGSFFKKAAYRLAVSPFLIKNKRILGEIDQIVVLDEMNKRRVMTAFGREAKIIHTGLDFPEQKKHAAVEEEEKDNGDNSFRLLSVGRVDKGKRVEDSLQALAEIKKTIPGARLDIVGSGGELILMQELAKELSVEKEATFHGNVENNKLSQLYHACDVFIFTAENQSWGLVPLEAMAHGKPCLVSTGCGVSELLTEGENCLKIEPRKPEDIVKGITRLHRDLELRNELAVKGKTFVEETFSWERYKSEMEKLFYVLTCKIK